MQADTALQHPEPNELDHVESVLLAYDGDFRHAIRDLIADADHLRLQLALTSAAMGRGFTRGWCPNGERNASEPKA